MEMNEEGKPQGKKIIPRGIHGLYVSLPKRMKIDGRSKFGKAIRQLRNSLIDDLGGDVSTQESLIVDRVVFKVLRLCSFEAFILKNSQEETEKQAREYLAMSNSLRLDLQALGLQRRVPQEEDLHKYIARTYGEEKKDEGNSGDA